MTKQYGLLDAAKDAFTGNLKITPKDEAARRYETCIECPHFSAALTCRLCGCFMPAKVKLGDATCPDNPPRW